ncbi:MAG: DUF2752 domain-containing protein [Tannerellaceae bacterium]
MSRSLLKYIVLLSLALTGLLAYYLFNPAEQLLFPKCPFLLLTGWQCPGCGSQRAIHDLLHFQIMDALRMNFLVVLAIPYIMLALYCEWMRTKSVRIERIYRLLYGSKASMTIAILFILFMIIRNI